MEASAEQNINDILNARYNTGKWSKYFSLKVDRKIRPTVVAVAKYILDDGKKQTDRQSLINSAEVFKAMLTALINAIRTVGDLDEFYLTYNWGSWQQTDAFHLKAHLTTEAFLALIQRLYDDTKCTKVEKCFNVCASEDKLTQELDKRHKSDNFGEKLWKLADENFVTLKEKSQAVPFYIGVCKLSYPLVSVYKNSGDRTISIEKMPAALNVLEKYVKEEWKQKGGAISMVLNGSEEPTCVSAVIDEQQFVECINPLLKEHKFVKDKVKAEWGWKDTDKWANPPFLVPAHGNPTSSYLFSYVSCLEGKLDDLVLKIK